MILIFSLLVVLGMFLYTSFSWGYVAYVTYGWFILPIAPTFPHLGVLQFIGIFLFLGCIIRSNNPNIKSEYVDKYSQWFTFICAPWITLGFSYLFYSLYIH